MERASVNLANSLFNRGINVEFLSFFKQEIFFKLERAITLIEPSGFNETSLSIAKTILWIRDVVSRDKYSAVIVFNKFYSAITLLALLRTKNKVIISERSSPLYKWDKKQTLFSSLVFSILKPAGIIAQTGIAKQYQQKFYGKDVPIQVIHNALRKIEEFPTMERKKIVLAVGRLGDPLKGFDRLVEAFAKIQSKDWKLQIAGGDENGQYLKDIAKRLGILNQIEFLGQVKNIDGVYATASIFVIPSRSEGFPNALCEAMAAGCACISYDFVAGPRDIINHGIDGIIVEEGNIDLLAMAIDELIENDEYRHQLGNCARGIIKRLNPDLIGEQILSFIKIIIDK